MQPGKYPGKFALQQDKSSPQPPQTHVKLGKTLPQKVPVTLVRILRPKLLRFQNIHTQNPSSPGRSHQRPVVDSPKILFEPHQLNCHACSMFLKKPATAWL
jgi:hypothetical protein